MKNGKWDWAADDSRFSEEDGLGVAFDSGVFGLTIMAINDSGDREDKIELMMSREAAADLHRWLGDMLAEESLGD